QQLINEHFICKGPGSGGPRWGCFQTMGNLLIDYEYAENSSINNYRRQLDLQSALAKTSIQTGKTEYSREYYTSFHNNAGVIRIKGNHTHNTDIRVSLTRTEKAVQ